MLSITIYTVACRFYRVNWEALHFHNGDRTAIGIDNSGVRVDSGWDSLIGRSAADVFSAINRSAAFSYALRIPHAVLQIK